MSSNAINHEEKHEPPNSTTSLSSPSTNSNGFLIVRESNKVLQQTTYQQASQVDQKVNRKRKAKNDNRKRKKAKIQTIESMLCKNGKANAINVANPPTSGITSQPDQTTKKRKLHPFFNQFSPENKAKQQSPSPKYEEKFIKLDGKDDETIIAEVNDLFLTPEQKKKKREMQLISEFRKQIQESKKVDSLFKGDAPHPFLLPRDLTKVKRSGSDVKKSVMWKLGKPVHVNPPPSIELKKPDSIIVDVFDCMQEKEDEDIEKFDYSKMLKKVELKKCDTKPKSSHAYNFEWTKDSEKRKLLFEQYLKSEKLKQHFLEFISSAEKKLNFKSSSVPLMKVEKLLELYSNIFKKRMDDKSTDFGKYTHELWTEKYRPTCKNEFCGSFEAVDKLWQWLSKWKSNEKEKKPKISKREQRLEFYFSRFKDDQLYDEPENTDTQLTNLMILTGDSGSGKTSSVYSCASALGFEVFEINTATHRSSTSVLKLFKEATESHQLGKYKSKQSSNVTPEKSLILFEDVDIVFKEDKGFMAAIRSLISTSKRPIVLTCNDPSRLTCIHDNIEPLTISFKALEDATNTETLIRLVSIPALVERLAYIHIIGLAEGFNFTIDELVPLIMHFKGDIRSILLNLQFWTQDVHRLPYLFDEICKVDSSSNACLSNLLEHGLGINNLCRSVVEWFCSLPKEYYIHRSIVDDLIHEQKQNMELLFGNYLDLIPQDYASGKDKKQAIQSMLTIMSFIDTTSALDFTLPHASDVGVYENNFLQLKKYIEALNMKYFASTIRKQTNMKSYPPQSKVVSLSNVFMQLPCYLKVRNQVCENQFKWNQSLAYKLAQKAMSDANKIHFSTDLLQAMISICKLEQKRQSANTKRRFFHYLKNILTDQEIATLASFGDCAIEKDDVSCTVDKMEISEEPSSKQPSVKSPEPPIQPAVKPPEPQVEKKQEKTMNALPVQQLTEVLDIADTVEEIDDSAQDHPPVDNSKKKTSKKKKTGKKTGAKKAKLKFTTSTDNDIQIVKLDGKEYVIGNNIFYIEKIIRKRVRKGKTQYFVKWLGYPDKDNSWVNESDILDKSVIERYEASCRQNTDKKASS